jgi:hypothetical protein
MLKAETVWCILSSFFLIHGKKKKSKEEMILIQDTAMVIKHLRHLSSPVNAEDLRNLSICYHLPHV